MPKNKYYGNYRAEVMSNSDEHGRVHVFIKGVYPDSLKDKGIEYLPLAEPAMPLTNGGHTLKIPNRDIKEGEPLPEIKDNQTELDELLEKNNEQLDLADIDANLLIESLDARMDSIQEAITSLDMGEIGVEFMQGLVDGQAGNLGSTVTYIQNLLKKLATSIVKLEVTGLDKLKAQLTLLKQRKKTYEEKLKNYPAHEVENIEATKGHIADLERQIELTELKILEEEEAQKEEQAEAESDTIDFGAMFTNTTGHSIGARKGQFVWVFFEGGNPKYPVYFATCPAGESWGSNAPGLIINNSKAVRNTIDESLYVVSDKDMVENLKKYIQRIEAEELAEFVIKNKHCFSEMNKQQFIDYIKEHGKVKNEEYETLAKASKPEILQALVQVIGENLTENEEFNKFLITENEPFGMFEFMPAEEGDEYITTAIEILRLMMKVTLYVPELAKTLLDMVKPTLDTILGTSIKVVKDETGKATYHVVIGGNVRILLNGNVDIVQNGSTNVVRTGASSNMSASNILIPFPLSLAELIGAGLMPGVPTAMTAGTEASGSTETGTE